MRGSQDETVQVLNDKSGMAKDPEKTQTDPQAFTHTHRQWVTLIAVSRYGSSAWRVWGGVCFFGLHSTLDSAAK